MQKIISAKPSLTITGLSNGPVCVVGPPATGVFEPCDRFSAKARYPCAYSHAQKIFRDETKLYEITT